VNVNKILCSIIGLQGLAAEGKLIFANTTVKYRSSEGGLAIPRN